MSEPTGTITNCNSVSPAALRAEADALWARASDAEAEADAARQLASTKTKLAAAVEARDTAAAAARDAEKAAGAALAACEASGKALAVASGKAAEAMRLAEAARDREVEARELDPAAHAEAAMAALAAGSVWAWNREALDEVRERHDADRAAVEVARAELRRRKDVLAAAEDAVSDPAAVQVPDPGARLRELIRRDALTRRAPLPGLSAIGIVRDGLPLPGGGAGG